MKPKAFTLTEAVVVLVLTAMLALVVLPRLTSPAKAGSSLESKTALESLLNLSANVITTEGALTDLNTINGKEKFNKSLGRFTLLNFDQPSTKASEISVYTQNNLIAAAVYNGKECYWVKKDFDNLAIDNFYGISSISYNGDCDAEKIIDIERSVNITENNSGKSWSKPMEIQ